MKIGTVDIVTPFVLAPMAGVNCTSFRLQCRQGGAGLIYTQMYHADFICHKFQNQGKRAIQEYINILPNEKPVSIQIVGHDPKTFLAAAKIIEPLADLIDVNLGCCDDNIIKSGAGAYFSKHTDRIPPLIEPLVKKLKIPVTAKIRIGWDSQGINGVAVAGMLQDLGVSAVAVHGRVAVQKYKGKANWEIIKHIKEKLSVPVIGNGDINNKQRALEMLSTGCDLAMIGRRAMGDPGIFTRCNNAFYHTDKEILEPKDLFFDFIEYYRQYDRNKSFSELRTHALWFAKRARIGPKKRKLISKAPDIENIKSIFLDEAV